MCGNDQHPEVPRGYIRRHSIKSRALCHICKWPQVFITWGVQACVHSVHRRAGSWMRVRIPLQLHTVKAFIPLSSSPPLLHSSIHSPGPCYANQSARFSQRKCPLSWGSLRFPVVPLIPDQEGLTHRSEQHQHEGCALKAITQSVNYWII